MENKKLEKLEKNVNRISIQQILVSHEKRIQELEKKIQEMNNYQLPVSDTFIQPTAPSASTNIIL